MKMFKKIVAAVLVLVLVLGISTCAMASGVKTFKTTANVNMRAKANTNGAKITVVPKGTEFNATDFCEGVDGTVWYYGSYGKEVGWVCGKYLSDGSEKPEAVQKITTGSVNMRASAGLKGAKIVALPKDTVMTVTDSRKDDRGVTWYYGTYGKKTGWVSGKYLKDYKGKPAEARKVTTGSVNLRKTPSLNGAQITVVPKNTAFTVGETQKDNRGVIWYRVTYGKNTGWISGVNMKDC